VLADDGQEAEVPARRWWYGSGDSGWLMLSQSLLQLEGEAERSSECCEYEVPALNWREQPDGKEKDVDSMSSLRNPLC